MSGDKQASRNWSPEQLGKMLAAGEITREEAAEIMALQARKAAQSRDQKIVSAIQEGRAGDVMEPGASRSRPATRVVNYALALLVALGALLALFYILLLWLSK